MADRDALKEIDQLMNSAGSLYNDVASMEKSLNQASGDASQSQVEIRNVANTITQQFESLNNWHNQSKEQTLLIQQLSKKYQDLSHKNSNILMNNIGNNYYLSYEKQHLSNFLEQDVSDYQTRQMVYSDSNQLPPHLSSHLTGKWINEKNMLEQIEKEKSLDIIPKTEEQLTKPSIQHAVIQKGKN